MTRDHIVATLRSIGPSIGSEAVALIEQIETERDELLAALEALIAQSPGAFDKAMKAIARSRK